MTSGHPATPEPPGVAPTGGRVLARGLLVVALLLGLEWFASGAAKLLAPDYVEGFASALVALSEGRGGPYVVFIDFVVLPNSDLFAAVLMGAELALGVAVTFTAAALLVLSASAVGPRRNAFGVLALASLAGALVSANIALASGFGPTPIGVPDPFDAAIGMDALLTALHLVIAGASLSAFRARAPHV